jgi:hypothetical protein
MDEKAELEALIAQQEESLRQARYPEWPFHICTPYVGLTTPGKKIVLIGLNPTGAIGRGLLDIYRPHYGIREEDYDRLRPPGKPSFARPRFTRCFKEVEQILGEPVGLIVTNIIWNASPSWKKLPRPLRVHAPLDRFFALIQGDCVVVVHGGKARKHYASLQANLSLTEPVCCPHFSPRGKGDLSDIAARIVRRFSAIR